MKCNDVETRPTVLRFPNLSVVIRFEDCGLPKRKLMVDAPDNIANGRFYESDWPTKAELAISEREHSERRHRICNCLQIAGFTIEILRRESLEVDSSNDAEHILAMAIESLNELESLASTRRM